MRSSADRRGRRSLQDAYIFCIERTRRDSISLCVRPREAGCLPYGVSIYKMRNNFFAMFAPRASLREGGGPRSGGRSLRNRGFDDRFGTFYMSLICAGSLRLLLRKIHLPPGGRRRYPLSNANIYFPRNFVHSSAGGRLPPLRFTHN